MNSFVFAVIITTCFTLHSKLIIKVDLHDLVIAALWYTNHGKVHKKGVSNHGKVHKKDGTPTMVRSTRRVCPTMVRSTRRVCSVDTLVINLDTHIAHL